MGDQAVDVALGVLTAERAGGWRVLITRRREAAVLGGYWEFPGGKVEVGETARKCVERELMEELGLVVRVGLALPEIEHEYPHGRVRLQPFYCTYEAGRLRSLGVAAFRWVAPIRLRRYRFLPANVGLVERLIQDLTGARGV